MIDLIFTMIMTANSEYTDNTTFSHIKRLSLVHLLDIAIIFSQSGIKWQDNWHFDICCQQALMVVGVKGSTPGAVFCSLKIMLQIVRCVHCQRLRPRQCDDILGTNGQTHALKRSMQCHTQESVTPYSK